MEIKPVLKPCCRLIKAFNSDSPLITLGEFWTTLQSGNKSVRAKYIVIKDKTLNAENLLSSKTSLDLGLITLSDAVKMQVNQLKETNHLESKPDELSVYAKEMVKQFPEVFADKIGKLKNYQVHLDIDKSVKPTQQPHYPIPYNNLAPTKEKLDFLEDNDIIERVDGEYSWLFPMLPVDKTKPGDTKRQMRITANCKKVNEAIIPQKYKMPNIFDLKHDLNGCEFFTKIDLREAFFQFELDEETRMLTAFSTPWGIYRYKRMFMGLNCASEIFHRELSKRLRDIKFVKVAIDDVLVAAPTEKEHDEAVEKLLKRLSDLGLTANAKKCEFKKKSITFFGMVISREGFMPNEHKMQAFLDAKPPSNASEARSFVGLANYLGPHISALSDLTEPIRELYSLPKKEFKWTEKCQKILKR